MVRGNTTDCRPEWVSYPGPEAEQGGYLVRPSPQGENKPGVLIIHENRGLDQHMISVARRLAGEGFLVLAADALAAQGGTPAHVDEAQAKIAELDCAANIANFEAAITFVAEHPECTGQVGCVGFCWGGGVANQLALDQSRLGAVVVYYGRPPRPEQVSRIQAPLLLHYAEHDDRINAAVPEFEAALKAAGKPYTLYRYPGAKHAFHNETRADRYHPAAADRAWKRTVEYLHNKLDA